MQTVTPISSGVEAFLAAFSAQALLLGSSEPAWLATQRREAIARFQDLGFPTTHDEDWRYTNVSPITQTSFQDGTVATAKLPALPTLWDAGKAFRLVFVNGEFQKDLSNTASLPQGVALGNLRALLSDSKWADVLRVYLGRTISPASNGFTALNSALWQDGACVIIPAGVVISEPIHVVNLIRGDTTAVACHPRTLVVCERDSQATIVETYDSSGPGVGLANSVTEVVAGEAAVIDLYKSTHCNDRSFHIGLLQAYASRGTQISTFSASLGGDLVRSATHVLLDGEGADCTLNGLYMAKGVQHVDNHTTIDHAKPHCASRQFYNGILDGHATGVFNGRVIVRPDAQKTDAVQKNRNLLLSTDATIDSKPQLEISANDVRCTHGATVGQMDAEALFFLRSRGLDRHEAMSMLVQAFASEILDKIKPSAYRIWLETKLTGQIVGNSVEAKQ